MSDSNYDPHSDYEIETGTFPAELLTLDRWFVWALDEGRKIPRAPWENPDYIEKYVSWKDRENWVDFETADEWAQKVDQFGHASCIPAFEDNSEERLIFFDFDDARDPQTGQIHGQAWAFIEKYGLSAYLSTSGTGVHAFGWGSLPEGYKPSFEIALPEWGHDEEPHLEVYASARFMALTGEHIAETPVGVPDLGDTVHELFEAKGTERTTGPSREPDVSREEISDIDTTTDVEDIYDAIAHVRPHDIRLRSTVTEEYSGRDAECALDPSWANSESGTRLAQFDDHWLYRKGNHNLDALQVVALEEGIIQEESEYPSGDDFVEAVDALRERGAHIPELETKTAPGFDVVNEESETPETEPEAEEAPTTHTDGGTDAASAGASSSPQRSRFQKFKTDVHGAIAGYEDDDGISERTARHRIAQAFQKHYHFVYPEQEVRGWRTTLYVYDDEEGVYEPRGEHFVEKQLEKAAGDYNTNQVTNEIIAKLERMSTERGPAFERDPGRIVVANGVLNLHTGELDPYSPAEYHRQKLDVSWNPDAGEPNAIDDFLHEVVKDTDVKTLYRLIAHTIYKEYIGEKAAILIGGGQNGKSVFLDLIEEFLGPYNVVHRELQDFDEDGFAANNLEGKLANLATEIGEQQLNDTTTFKKLTGRDTMDAPVKFEKPLTFENYATLMFATNEMPVFGQDNHAIWRRWVYVDFPYKFDATDPDAKDPEPKDILMGRMTDETELEALLLRCQQEIQRWHEDPDEEFFADAMPPEEVRDKMKKAAEPVFNFASTCLTVGDDEETFVEKSVVRAAYRAYAEEEDLPTIPENEFGKRLVGLRDFALEPAQRRVDGSVSRVYNGIELSSRGRQVLGMDASDDDQQSEVDDAEQATVVVMDELRTMVEENDNQPVPRDGLVWRMAGKIGKATAERAVDTLAENGRLMEGADGILPNE